MWRNIGFGDTRLSSNSHVMKKWQHYIIESKGKQKFLMGYEGGGGGGIHCDDLSGHMDDSSRATILSDNDLDGHYIYSLVDVFQFSVGVVCCFLFVFLIRRVVEVVGAISIECCQRPTEEKAEEKTPLSTPLGTPRINYYTRTYS